MLETYSIKICGEVIFSFALTYNTFLLLLSPVFSLDNDNKLIVNALLSQMCIMCVIDES